MPQALLLTSLLVLPQCAKLDIERKRKKKKEGVEEDKEHMDEEEKEKEEALGGKNLRTVKKCVLYQKNINKMTFYTLVTEDQTSRKFKTFIPYQKVFRRVDQGIFFL